jgi:subtilisin family serine protease
VKVKNILFFLCLISLTATTMAQDLPTWPQKIDDALWAKMTSQPEQLPFLVLMNEQAPLPQAGQLKKKEQKADYVFTQLKQTAAASQADLISFLQEQRAEWQSFFIVNLLAVTGSPELLQTIARRDDVAQILDNATYRMLAPLDAALETSPQSRSLVEWGLERINADDVWALGYRGQGVVIGGQDTGYDWEHPALKPSYRGYDAASDEADHNYNWHDAIHSYSPLNSDTLNPCGLDSPVPCDDNFHGTHTMGTMTGLDGSNVIGVAPESRWCACRNMERGWGSASTYLECFQWFLAPTSLDGQNPDPSKAPHVINNSWYCPEVEGCNPSNFALMDQAIDNLRAAGTVVVVSAGNSGSECSSVSAPAAMYEGSFSVGATAQNDTIAGFSSRGPVLVDGSGRMKPNVAAPGVGVRSAIPNGGYASFSGTSMAGPHVAGLVALIISANPELAGQVQLIEEIIQQTAVPKTTNQTCGNVPGSQVPNHTYGFGRVDALAAVEAALESVNSTIGTAAPASLQVFPNPSSGQLFVKAENCSGNIRFLLYDLNGRLVFSHNDISAGSGATALPGLDNQPAGIYFYRAFAGTDSWSGKIILE